MAAGRCGRGVAFRQSLRGDHELPLSGGRALTKRYRALLEQYGLRSTRIFPRKAHENGVVEQALELTRFRRRCWGERKKEAANAKNPSTIRAGVSAPNHRVGARGAPDRAVGARVRGLSQCDP